MSSLKYAQLFLERGFNAIIYDQRRHGKSGGKTTSYGYFEKYDLKAVVDWLLAKEGEEILLGIHGESMGAATALLYAGELDNRAHFYIVDCPFSDLQELLTYQLKCEMKLLPAKFALPIGNMFIKFRGKYSIKDVSPIAVIDRIEQPILFIQSEKEDFNLPYMTKDLYDKKKGAKMLFMAKNGAHAQSLNENRSEYEAMIDKFLETYGFIKTIHLLMFSRWMVETEKVGFEPTQRSPALTHFECVPLQPLGYFSTICYLGQSLLYKFFIVCLYFFYLHKFFTVLRILSGNVAGYHLLPAFNLNNLVQSNHISFPFFTSKLNRFSIG